MRIYLPFFHSLLLSPKKGGGFPFLLFAFLFSSMISCSTSLPTPQPPPWGSPVLWENSPEGETETTFLLTDLSTQKIYLYEEGGNLLTTTTYPSPPTSSPGLFRGFRSSSQYGWWIYFSSTPYLLPVTIEGKTLHPGEWQKGESGTLFFISGIPSFISPTYPENGIFPFPLTSAQYPFWVTELYPIVLPGEVAIWDREERKVVRTFSLSSPSTFLQYRYPWLLLEKGGEIVLLSLETGEEFPYSYPYSFYQVHLTESFLFLITPGEGILLFYLPSKEKGTLCLLSPESPELTTLSFLDIPPLSTPSLKVLSLNDPSCPGKGRSDLYELSYEIPPSLWKDLLLPENEIPNRSWLQIGDSFVTSQKTYTLKNTDPIQWDPPLTSPEKGVLIPKGRFLIKTRTRGEIGTLPLNTPFYDRGVSFVLEEGKDPPSPGDRFLLEIQFVREGIGKGRFPQEGTGTKSRFVFLDPVRRILFFVSREKGNLEFTIPGQ